MSIPSLLDRAKEARKRGLSWLLAHVDTDGCPADSQLRTGWCRLGWALALGGEQAAAACVVDWAARYRLDGEGNFLPGFMKGQTYIARYPNYWLGTFVVSAWMAGRGDIARRSMDVLRRRQDPLTGGLPFQQADGQVGDINDLLSTAQTGLAALVTGQMDMADRVFGWIERLSEQQPAGSQFHMCRKGDTLLTEPASDQRWHAIADFALPRQTFFGPGMAAVFLAPYAQMRSCPDAMRLAQRLLRYNVEGTDEQFSDPDSVQACKFGWAVGVMYQHDQDDRWSPWIQRMTEWFIAHQASDGSWSPSRFAEPKPSDAERLVKTSEHVMELTALTAALATLARTERAAMHRDLHRHAFRNDMNFSSEVRSTHHR